VAMQAEPGVGAVVIDQASLRLIGDAGRPMPEVEYRCRDRGPRPAGDGMGGGVAIAADLREPAQGTAVGHADRQRLARARHDRAVERALDQEAPNLGQKGALLLGGQEGGEKAHSAYLGTRPALRYPRRDFRVFSAPETVAEGPLGPI